MTAARDPVTREYMGITCDGPGCGKPAPEAKILLEHYGLINMGWRCTGGTHYCPNCKDAADALHSPR